MSERYGRCPACKGTGTVLEKTGVRDPITLIDEQVRQPCCACGESGHSGDAFEEPGYKADQQARQEEDLNARGGR